ncbi:tRNA (cytosine-C5-)-methyltransferase [Saccharomycopsis crataegensis]|uniref:tRNA (Cytosine-C5-)-methyltransferase n=1 Tax=Saccharomycopsis crataegensis TaxID=43959 RepID=A0AAV5QFR7_9ASCO|nr:tRNA (cytosine-C5-)-methyltransferase [Saccharomycopsis crataegensis]
MGKRNNRGGKKSFGKRGASNWVEVAKENEKWESYYKTQGLINDDEWDSFKSYCQKQLPLTFRITGSRSHQNEIKQMFKEKHVPILSNVDEKSLNITTEELASLEPPKPMKWYPNELAWQLNIPKGVMKKNEAFQKTQRFLVVETEVGNISRQEAVSMIPPLLLDVQPHHYVLDMCAAPGSKTAQLVEKLHENCEDSIPTGFVVANDSDYRRSHMLVHQVKRLNSPNFVVINHDGQMLPKFRLQPDGPYVKFDRILCDVPCTGDATMRKNINVWRDWTIGNALGLHTLQLNILTRGIQYLKPGGRLVYSTCSLNPVENEAVITAALKKFEGKIRLVNVSNELPGLVRRDGVSSWKVLNKKGEELANVEELEKKQAENPVDNKVPTTVFPPSAAEAEDLHLEYAVRVYPHLQNTGGFFIAVLEKVVDEPEAKPVDTKKRTIEEAADSTTTTTEAVAEEEPNKKQKVQEEEVKVTPVPTMSEKQQKHRLPRDANEEPFIFIPESNPILKKCWSFYSVSDDFPKHSCLVRNATGEPIRSIYFVAPVIKQILTVNESRLKFIHSGIKLFVSQKSTRSTEALWRLQSESLVVLKPFLGNARMIELKELEVLKSLLMETFPSMTAMKELSQSFYDQMSQVDEEGCCFLNVLRPDGEDIFLPVWKGKTNINLMLNKHDTFELLYRIFGIETDKNTTYKQDASGHNSRIVVGKSEESKESEPQADAAKEPETKEAESKEPESSNNEA